MANLGFNVWTLLLLPAYVAITVAKKVLQIWGIRTTKAKNIKRHKEVLSKKKSLSNFMPNILHLHAGKE